MEEKKPDISQEEKDVIIQVTTAIETEAHKIICLNVYNAIQKEKDKDPKIYDHIWLKSNGTNAIKEFKKLKESINNVYDVIYEEWKKIDK